MFNKQIKYFPLLWFFFIQMSQLPCIWLRRMAFSSHCPGFSASLPHVLFNACEIALRLNPCLGYWPLVALLAKAPLWFRIGYDLFMGMRVCGLMWLLLSAPPPHFHLMHSLDPKWSTVNALFSQISVIPGITSLEELLKNKFWSVSQFSTGNGHWICQLGLL